MKTVGSGQRRSETNDLNMKKPSWKPEINSMTVGITAVFVFLILVFFGIYFSHFPVLLGHWSKEDYSHCYLVPPLFAYLLWNSKDKIIGSMGGTTFPGIAVLILAMMFFTMGRLGSLETFVYISMWMSLAGIALLVFGFRASKAMLFPFLILGFAVPLPPFLNNMLSLNLKLWSSALAVEVLQVLSVPVYREGNLIDLGITQLQVVDACSGLRYFFPTMLMALLIGHFFLRKNLSRVILFAVSPLLTLLSNAFRIAVTGLLVRYYNPELAEGFFHDFSGWLVYIFTLVFLGSITIFFRRLEARSGGKGKLPLKPALNETRRLDSPGVKWKTILAGVIILIIGWTTQAHMASSQIIPERNDFSTFPSEFDNWHGQRLYLSQNILDSLWADDYVTGNFRNDETGNTMHLLISYYETQTTRKTAHAPTSCLLGGGWILRQKGIAPPNPEKGRDFPVQSMLLEQGGVRILSNFWFEQRGRLITSEYMNKLYLLWDAMTMRRTDGALVRAELYLLPEQTVTQGQQLMDSFLAELRDTLPGYIPGG